MSEYLLEPTQKTYFLRCRIKFFKKVVKDHNRSYERELVLLVPDDSDQRTSFLNAWLPEIGKEYFELAAIIPPPVDSPCRLSIHRAPDERSERHYLFVMTKGVEEVILKYLKDGSVIDVKILPEGADDIVDKAVDSSEGNYNLISGQETL